MRNIFSLLVAINNYHQSEITDLNGCLNDLEGINTFLENLCKKDKDLRLHKKLLKDLEATRQAVIDGFKIFEKAQDGDVCLFYFSGHGSQIDAPKEFWNESNSKLEAIVCHVKEGNDNLILDKELSFLISNAQKDKDVHFLVITDSCHSGSNTKDYSSHVRSVLSNINSKEVDTYLGRKYYKEIKGETNSEVRLSAPIGKHYKLSACTSAEVAKEKNLGRDGKFRGIFTYAMLEVLKNHGYNLSYLTLASKVRVKAQSLTRDQSPQLETIGLHPQERSRIFLNGLLENQQPTFQVSHKNNEDGWEINVGSIYGVSPKDVVYLLNDDIRVEIKSVHPTYSTLDFGPLQFQDRGKIFDAIVIAKSRKRLNISIDDSIKNDAHYAFLLELLKNSPRLKLCDDQDVDYTIRTFDDVIALTHPESNTPVFARIHNHGEAQSRLFLKLIEQVSEWHHVKAISNPNSKIKESEVEILLSAVEKPYTVQESLIDSLPSVPEKEWQGNNIFCYHFDDNHPKGPWHQPAFRLSITNRSKRSLWISALYCGSGYTTDGTGRNFCSTSFSITNRFLSKEKIAPGDTAKLTDELNNFEIESIDLSLLDDYFDQGFSEIKDLIKVFLSTEEMDTDPFNMVGIPIDVENIFPSRASGKLPSIIEGEADWKTFDIPIITVKPRDEGILSYGKSIIFNGITIIRHPIFSARIVLSTMEEFIRSTKITKGQVDKYMRRPELLYGSKKVRHVELTNGLGDVEGCSVIELYRTKEIESISSQKPLIFKIDESVSTSLGRPDITLVGYSSKKRAYFKLGVMNENREILVHALPPASSSLIDGIGDSIKLILLEMKVDFQIPELGI